MDLDEKKSVWSQIIVQAGLRLFRLGQTTQIEKEIESEGRQSVRKEIE